MPIYTPDPQFIDVDFDAENPNPGEPLGFAGFGDMDQACAGAFGDNAAWMVPASQQREKCEQMEQRLRDLVQRVQNQGRVPQCVSSCTTACMERADFIATGSRYVQLAGKYMHSTIGLGRNGNRGAYMYDGATFARDVGCLPLDTPENLVEFDHVSNDPGYDAGLQGYGVATANLFRTEFYTCRSVDEKISAMLNGWMLITGRSGHSIPYMFAIWSRNEPIVAYLNSWGAAWGDIVNDKVGRGLGWDSNRTFKNATCYAVMRQQARPQTTDPVPTPSE